jgi:peptidoglycan/xylan/chitin deacetylase (PgdA/CDA1 family)
MAVTILYYHRVGPPRQGLPRKGFVTPEAFRSQMGWIRRCGWSVLALDDAVAALAAGRRLARRSVVLTFDDGYIDCATYARPVLEALRFPAAFFIVSGLAGKTDRWSPTHGSHPERLMGWDDLRALRRAGFTIGSHTVTHRRLTDLAPREAYREMAESRAQLEAHVGAPVRYLAYPQGAWSPGVAGLARDAGYRSALATRGGLQSLFSLPRVPVGANDSLAAFAGKLVKGSLGVYAWRARFRRSGREGTAAGAPGVS